MLKHAPTNVAFLLALVCVSNAALAQSAPSGTPLKAIGTPSAHKSEVVPSLIVMNSRGATLQSDTLTLTGARQ